MSGSGANQKIFPRPLHPGLSTNQDSVWVGAGSVALSNKKIVTAQLGSIIGYYPHLLPSALLRVPRVGTVDFQ